ncbi:uncharacterized protein FPRN_00109 [Fusarium proliferatum]|nr:uncharacterized protein FPRN_00109 [Fusarium proliferatum]
MNLGNSEPRQVAGESSLQSSHGANKRRRHDQNGGVDDGPKYPGEKPTIVSFECLFCKENPHRYPECRGLRLTRLSDVIQHIKRQHLLVEVRLGAGTAIPEHIILYCARCRCLFCGTGAAFRLEVHSNQKVKCRPVTIEQGGVLTPKEFEELKSELGSCKGKSEEEKWFIIWVKCFPEKDPPRSPKAEISVPRLQLESILHYELGSIQGLKPEQVQSIVTRSADRIYKTSSHPRSSHTVPLQAQSNALQTTPVPTHDTTTCMPSDTEFATRTLQPQMQDFDYSSGPTYLGVHGTPTGGQEENSFDWNNTLTNYSAPSPVPDSGAHTTSGSNFVDAGYFTAPVPGYPPVPYVGYHTGSFELASQDHGYLNTHGKTTGRRGPHY